MNKLSDKGSTDGGSRNPGSGPGTQGPRPIRSAFEDKSPSIPLRKRRRLGEAREKTVLEKKLGTPSGCRVCGGAHPSRMCDVGA